MGRGISIPEAAALLLEQDDILILCHRNPDGDTLGSGFGLLHGLKSLGKRVKLSCSDPLPEKYSYMFQETSEYFKEKFVVAVDVADTSLLGDKLASYADKVDLCVDHHSSHRDYAKNLLLEGDSAAACEVVYLLLKEMKVAFSPLMADCIYTGIATDTGCFRYSNTTVRTHRIAGELMELGCRYSWINTRMFETTTRSRLAVEKEALAGLEYCFGDRCAIITLSRDMIEGNGSRDDELEGIAAIPRQIEGVQVGVTLKELKDRSGYKISLRTTEEADASKICSRLGGGGHARAAGCTVNGSREEARIAILSAIAAEQKWEDA